MCAWRAGGEVFIWFVGLQDRTLVTGPSEKSACVLRGRRVCTINYFTPRFPASAPARPARPGSARRATRARAGRAPPRSAPPSAVCSAQRAPPPLSTSSTSLLSLGHSLARAAVAPLARTPLAPRRCRSLEPPPAPSSERDIRVYSLFNQLSTRVPSFNLGNTM